MTIHRANEGRFIHTLKEHSVIGRIIAIAILVTSLILFRFNAISLKDTHAESIFVGFLVLILCIIAIHTLCDLALRLYYSKRAK